MKNKNSVDLLSVPGIGRSIASIDRAADFKKWLNKQSSCTCLPNTGNYQVEGAIGRWYLPRQGITQKLAGKRTRALEDQSYLFKLDMSGKLVWKVKYGNEYTGRYPGTWSSATISGDLRQPGAPAPGQGAPGGQPGQGAPSAPRQ